MGQKFSYFDTSSHDCPTWEKLCPPGEYRVVPPSALSGLLPAGLLAKADSVLIVASGCSQGTVVWMANANRVDAKASGIDQEPFGIVFHGDTPAMSGCLVHHGSWCERTMPAPPQFWDAIAASGIGNCYPFSGLPSNTAGPISELSVPSQHGAFGVLVDKLKGSLMSGG
jgi:hypothetical protein